MSAEVTTKPPRRPNAIVISNLLNEAFQKIADPDDWKGPVDCIVPWELANLFGQAILHVTATEPSYEAVEDDLTGRTFARIRAAGYRAGPVGDH